MSRSLPKRRLAGHEKTHPVLAAVLAVALALLAFGVWHALRPPPLVPLAEPRRIEPPRPNAEAQPEGEEFSSAERQRLEDILKRHGGGK